MRERIGIIVDVDGVGIHVREDGPTGGAPVVLLHGFVSSMHWFDRVTALLADTLRVIRFDLPGHGASGLTDLDPIVQARVLGVVLERLDVAGATVVGHSWGADIALALAEYSGLVRKVVIIGQAPDYTYADAPTGVAAVVLAKVLAASHHWLPDWVIGRGVAMGFAVGFRLDSAFDERNRVVLDFADTHAKVFDAVAVDRPARLAARPLDVQLKALGLPALVVHGSQDAFYSVSKTAVRYEAVGARVEIIEGSGHSPNIERPVQVARLIREFVAS